MDSQIRNFKDFLFLYNRVTELCFNKCAENFFNRQITAEESSCVDNCVGKFANVNQKIMSVYVDVQTDINTKRLAELEAQQQQVAATDIEAGNSSNLTGTSPAVLNEQIKPTAVTDPSSVQLDNISR